MLNSSATSSSLSRVASSSPGRRACAPDVLTAAAMRRSALRPWGDLKHDPDALWATYASKPDAPPREPLEARVAAAAARLDRSLLEAHAVKSKADLPHRVSAGSYPPEGPPVAPEGAPNSVSGKLDRRRYAGDADLVARGVVRASGTSCWRAALAELRAALPACGWPASAPVVATPAAARGGRQDGAKADARIEDLMAAGVVDAAEEFAAVLVDVTLLSDCDAFVGKFTSNMDRLVFALMSGRRGGCVPPYASIDSRWCFDFGVRSGRTLGNESFKC